MHKIQASDSSASNLTPGSFEDSQDRKTDDEQTYESLSLDLLNAGGRVVKGKLRKVDPRKVRRSRMANRSIENEDSADFRKHAANPY